MHDDTRKALKALGMDDETIDNVDEATDAEIDEMIAEAFKQRTRRGLEWWNAASGPEKTLIASTIAHNLNNVKHPPPTQILFLLAELGFNYLATLNPEG